MFFPLKKAAKLISLIIRPEYMKMKAIVGNSYMMVYKIDETLNKV